MNLFKRSPPTQTEPPAIPTLAPTESMAPQVSTDGLPPVAPNQRLLESGLPQQDLAVTNVNGNLPIPDPLGTQCLGVRKRIAYKARKLLLRPWILSSLLGKELGQLVNDQLHGVVAK